MEVDSYVVLGATYIDKQLKALTKQIKAIRSEDDDIEPIHQARVASRRLRAALRMFADRFESKRVKNWEKCIKRLTRGLGEARDADVHIDFLERFLFELTPDQKAYKPGIRRLILRLKQQRKSLDQPVEKVLKKLESSGVVEDLAAAVARVRWAAKLHPVPEPDETMLRETNRRIQERLVLLLGYESCLADESAGEQHHKLRIAAKSLRYTMEICRDAYEGKLDPFIKAVKKIQTFAGEAHDCDIWAESIDSFIEQEHERTMDYFGYDRQRKRLRPGLEYLKESCRMRRAVHFENLKNHWQTLHAAGTWSQLQSLLSGRSETDTAETRPIDDVPSATPVEVNTHETG